MVASSTKLSAWFTVPPAPKPTRRSKLGSRRSRAISSRQLLQQGWLPSFVNRTAWSAPLQGWPWQCHALRRSEEHTSELQSLMRISYAVFCLKKKKNHNKKEKNTLNI